MTDWKALSEPFPDSEIKTRPGAAKWGHRDACQKRQCNETRDPDKHIQFSYVDARVVAQRLDDVLTPEGWDFQWTSEGGDVVHGKLIIGGNIREDAGYPNSDDDAEPIKSAVSDALKRCAVLFGVGRHLYEDNKGGTGRSSAPQTTPSQTIRHAPNRPTLVDTDLLEDDEENPFDDPASTAPIVRPEPTVCPWHPDRTPKEGKYGLYCTGQGGNGPLNGKGYCNFKFAA